MKRSLSLTSLMLSLGLITTSARSAEAVNADLTTGLNEMGTLSVSDITGSMQDVERLIAWQADQHGAAWYRIINMQQNQRANSWQAQAILYASIDFDTRDAIKKKMAS